MTSTDVRAGQVALACGQAVLLCSNIIEFKIAGAVVGIKAWRERSQGRFAADKGRGYEFNVEPRRHQMLYDTLYFRSPPQQYMNYSR